MSASRLLIVSVHDVAPPDWDRVQRMLDALGSVGVSRRSLLVIPNLHGQWPIDRHPAFCAQLRDLQRAGDEIVLHGYEHVGVGAPEGLVDRFRNRWFTNGEGEFLSLDYWGARDRITLGLAQAGRANLDVRGFIAPAWLINPLGLRAARDCGFDYTNSYCRITDLAHNKTWFAPSLVFGPGHLSEDLGVSLQRRLTGLLRGRPVVRVVLHPPCIDHPSRFERILEMVKILAIDRHPITYLEWLSQLRQSASGRSAA